MPRALIVDLVSMAHLESDPPKMTWSFTRSSLKNASLLPIILSPWNALCMVNWSSKSWPQML